MQGLAHVLAAPVHEISLSGQVGTAYVPVLAATAHGADRLVVHAALLALQTVAAGCAGLAERVEAAVHVEVAVQVEAAVHAVAAAHAEAAVCAEAARHSCCADMTKHSAVAELVLGSVPAEVAVHAWHDAQPARYVLACHIVGRHPSTPVHVFAWPTAAAQAAANVVVGLLDAVHRLHLQARHQRQV